MKVLSIFFLLFMVVSCGSAKFTAEQEKDPLTGSWLMYQGTKEKGEPSTLTFKSSESIELVSPEGKVEQADFKYNKEANTITLIETRNGEEYESTFNAIFKDANTLQISNLEGSEQEVYMLLKRITE